MDRYLIELPHDERDMSCWEVVRVLLETGSHFLTNADWGCLDGEHKAWITVDAESREAARCLLPVAFRSQAKIVKLKKFTLDELNEFLRHHQDTVSSVSDD